MASPRSRSPVLLLAAAAGALGLVLALLASVIGDGPPPPPAEPGEPPRETAPEETAPEPPRDIEAIRAQALAGDEPLAKRFDSGAADVRHATVRELLEEGPDALAQVTALRPQGEEARRLRRLLSQALTEWRTIRENPRYDAQPEVARLNAKLKAYATVLPLEWCRPERRAYWAARVERLDEAVRGGRDLAEGRVSLARLELATVRYELREIPREEWIRLREKHGPTAREWVAAMQAQRGVSSADKQRYADQIARLLR